MRGKWGIFRTSLDGFIPIACAARIEVKFLTKGRVANHRHRTNGRKQKLMKSKIKNMRITTRCMAGLLAGLLAGLAPGARGQVFGGAGGATTLAGSAAIAGATHMRGNTAVGGPCSCAPGSKVAAGSFLKAGSVVNGSALASDTTLAEA